MHKAPSSSAKTVLVALGSSSCKQALAKGSNTKLAAIKLPAEMANEEAPLK